MIHLHNFPRKGPSELITKALIALCARNTTDYGRGILVFKVTQDDDRIKWRYAKDSPNIWRTLSYSIETYAMFWEQKYSKILDYDHSRVIFE